MSNLTERFVTMISAIIIAVLMTFLFFSMFDGYAVKSKTQKPHIVYRYDCGETIEMKEKIIDAYRAGYVVAGCDGVLKYDPILYTKYKCGAVMRKTHKFYYEKYGEELYKP